MPEIQITENLVASAIEVIAAVIEEARRESRRASIVLSGGSTPKALFEALGHPSEQPRLPWDRLELFWGDERPVPADDPDSNYGGAWRLWLSQCPIPSTHIHPWPTQYAPAEAARLYAKTLRDCFVNQDPPQMDLIFLGLGPEGHTASLFPHSPALETEAWTSAVWVPDKGSWRLTLTPRVINHARRVVFLVQGSDKSDIVAQVLKGPFRGPALPAQLITPRARPALWLLDSEAAARLG